MEFKPKNLYKLHLNNQNNIVSGVGTRKFTLNLPSYFPKDKQCYVYVEQTQLQIKSSAGALTGDYFALNYNLISQNSYSNTHLNRTGILCYFATQRIKGNPNTNMIVELINPTKPILIGFLPSQIELFISDPISANEGQAIELEADFELCCTICCQFVD